MLNCIIAACAFAFGFILGVVIVSVRHLDNARRDGE